VTAPGLLRPLNVAWHRLGLALGRVAVPLTMAVVFFVAVTPVAAALRLMGKDPLRLKRRPDAASYWIERRDSAAPGDMTQQY
jgi:hypothetical protein